MTLHVDDHPGLIRLFNLPRIEDKTMRQLEGIAAGIVCDGRVTDEEVQFLGEWLEGHREFASVWPASRLFELLQNAVADRRIEPCERKVLYEFLCGCAAPTGLTDASPPRAPEQEVAQSARDTRPTSAPAPGASFFDEVADLTFPARRFCFTGKMKGIPLRRRAEDRVRSLGGDVTGSVSEDLHYLIVGELGSDAWAFGRFGRKIQRAIDLRASGHVLKIVRESVFVASLVAVPS